MGHIIIIHLLGTTRLLPRLQHLVSLYRLRSSILVQPLSFSRAIDDIYVRVDQKMIGVGIQILIHAVKEQRELGAYH